SDTQLLLAVSAIIVAMPRPRALTTLVLIASSGQRPSTCTSAGLLSHIARLAICVGVGVLTGPFYVSDATGRDSRLPHRCPGGRMAGYSTDGGEEPTCGRTEPSDLSGCRDPSTRTGFVDDFPLDAALWLGRRFGGKRVQARAFGLLELEHAADCVRHRPRRDRRAGKRVEITAVGFHRPSRCRWVAQRTALEATDPVAAGFLDGVAQTR